jgi:hypothetical protein
VLYTKPWRTLLARWASKSRAQPDRCAKVRCVVRVPIDLLHHGVSVAIARSVAVGSGVKHVPDLLAVRAGEEPTSLLAPNNQLDVDESHPLCPGP